MFAMHLAHGMFPKKVPENVGENPRALRSRDRLRFIQEWEHFIGLSLSDVKETRSFPSWVNEERAYDVSALKVTLGERETQDFTVLLDGLSSIVFQSSFRRRVVGTLEFEQRLWTAFSRRQASDWISATPGHSSLSAGSAGKCHETVRLWPPGHQGHLPGNIELTQTLHQRNDLHGTHSDHYLPGSRSLIGTERSSDRNHRQRSLCRGKRSFSRLDWQRWILGGHGSRSDGNRSWPVEEILQSRLVVMSEESAFSHSLAKHVGKSEIESRCWTRTLSFRLGIELVETSQRLPSLVDIGNSSEISHHSPSVEHQDHLRSPAGSEEKSPPDVRDLDTGWIQQGKCGTFPDVVRPRLVSRDHSGTTEIHSPGTGRETKTRVSPDSFRAGRSSTNSLKRIFELLTRSFIGCANEPVDSVSVRLWSIELDWISSWGRNPMGLHSWAVRSSCLRRSSG